MTNKFIEAFERGEDIFTRNKKNKVILIREYKGDNAGRNYVLEVVLDDGLDYECHAYLSDGRYFENVENGYDLILPKRKGWIARYKIETSLVSESKSEAINSLSNRMTTYLGFPPAEVEYIEVDLDE